MELFNLYLSFAKIGFTSFGGISMLPLIFNEVTSHGWLTASEVTDIVAIAEMTPGPLGLNCATFAGIRACGPLGAAAATLGVLTPTFTICFAAAFFFERFKNSSLMQRVLLGVRPASLGLVAGVVVTLFRSSYFEGGAPQWTVLLIGVIAAVWLWKRKPSVPAVLAGCAALGLLIVR